MKISTAYLVALLIAPLANVAADGMAKPNIVFILADDLGYADVGFNGGTNIATPHLDKLAREGTVLQSCYAQPLCSPARAALLTGRLATHTGVYTVIRPGVVQGLPLNERLLPQALREGGYTTAICGKWHLGEARPEFQPLQRGFDHQYGHYMGNLDYFTHLRDNKLDWYRDGKPLVEEGYTTELIAKEACRLIQGQPADKPLFLYVPFNAIHTPLQVPEHYLEPYQPLPQPRRNIAGMTAAADEAVGKIIEALDKNGMRENTLILFASDNGGSQPGKRSSNTPLRGGKGSVYEGGIRVCALANWPGKIPAGAINDQPLHLSDWYPTLIKLAGAPADQPLPVDGRDLWPMLTQGAKSPHQALLIPGTTPSTMALRMGDWKLVATGNAARDKEKSYELYNLAEDISEKHDLAVFQPEKMQEMIARCQSLSQDAVPENTPEVIGD